MPPKVIEILIKQGWISFPIPPEQDWGLRLLMAEFPRYTKIERFVLKLLLNLEDVKEEGAVPKRWKKYSSKEIKEMIWSYYGQSVSDEDMNRLRQTARDYRRQRASNKNKANLLLALSKSG